MNENTDVVLHSYSRAQAIADGVLKDVSTLAILFGFRVPVAITIAAWHHCVASDEAEGADELWRVGSVLNGLFEELSSKGKLVPNSFAFVPLSLLGQYVPTARPFELKAVLGPDDDGAPCITVMLPNED